MTFSRFSFFLFFAVAVPASLFAADAAKPKPDPVVAETVRRGVLLYRDGDLVGARKEINAALKLSPEEPRALEYKDKIEKAFRERAEDLLAAAKKSRLAADKHLALLLDGQPNTAEGMKETMKALAEAAEKQDVPMSDLEWFMMRPSKEPFTGERAEKLNRMKGSMKGKK